MATNQDPKSQEGEVAPKAAIPSEVEVKPEPQPPVTDKGEAWDPARAMETIQKLRGIEKQAEIDRKELKKFQEAEAARQEAELSEAQKAQKRAEELEKENSRLTLEVLRREVADEVGLMPALSVRLRGSTKEELLKDAEELIKILPTQIQPKVPPHVPPSNPNNANTNETEQQKRERLFGRTGQVFNMEEIKAGGGGVVWVDKKE